MKFGLLCMAFIFLILSCAIPLEWESALFQNFTANESNRLGSSELGYSYKRIGNLVRVFGNDTTVTKGIFDIPIDNIRLNTETGFMECTIDGHVCKIVLGNEYLFFAGEEELMHTGISMMIPNIQQLRKESGFYSDEEKEAFLFTVIPLSEVAEEIYTSSFLEENIRGEIIRYDGKDIEKYLIFRDFANILNPYCLPWVEGRDGAGIGEWLEINLKTAQSTVYILNGFVDPSRPSLFRMNSRIRDAEISGITQNGKTLVQTVSFEDFIYFKTIEFREPVKKIRVTIKTVYPGNKWQDTTVSAIMFPMEL